MAKRRNHSQALELLKAAVKNAGSQAKWADANKISRQYLTDVLHGRREVSGKILDALGLERVVEYQVK